MIDERAPKKTLAEQIREIRIKRGLPADSEIPDPAPPTSNESSGESGGADIGIDVPEVKKGRRGRKKHEPTKKN